VASLFVSVSFRGVQVSISWYQLHRSFPQNERALVCVSLSNIICACMCVCQSDEDYETYDTLLELDELLNLDTDAERTAYIQVHSLV